MKDGHGWDLSPRQARILQEQLAREVSLQALPQDFEILGAADIAYIGPNDQLVAAVVTFRWPTLERLEISHVVAPVSFPYVPGLLSFREIPPVAAAFHKLITPPQVLLCDGHGLAHPRRFGLASHLGVYLKIPTVGCAKKLLCGEHETLELKRQAAVPLYYKNERVGWVFCSRDGVKPVYISPGHLSDLDSSKHLVSRCLGRFRIPEPLREAHRIVTALRTGISHRRRTEAQEFAS